MGTRSRRLFFVALADFKYVSQAQILPVSAKAPFISNPFAIE